MSPQYSLEAVAANFNQWRETRHSNREITPPFLQKQVAALQKQHKAITIRNALNISSAAFNRWCKTYNTQQEASSCPSFITIPPEDLKVGEDQKESTVLCEFPNGVRLNFNTETLSLSVLTQLFCLERSAVSA
tara:strand:- start:1715 stop:2113 length:399 start_codon:yes stop_codon:yes gene_type:complete